MPAKTAGTMPKMEDAEFNRYSLRRSKPSIRRNLQCVCPMWKHELHPLGTPRTYPAEMCTCFSSWDRIGCRVHTLVTRDDAFLYDDIVCTGPSFVPPGDALTEHAHLSVRTGAQRASSRSKSADTATRCSTVCAECCTTCNPGSALSRSSKGQRSSNRSRISKSEHEREVKREGSEGKHHYQNFALEAPSAYDIDSDEMDPIYAVLQNTPYKVERAEEKVYSLTKPTAKQLNGIHQQLVQAEVYNSSGLPVVPGRPNKKGKHAKNEHHQQDHHGDKCSQRNNQRVHNHNNQNNAANGNLPLLNGNLPHGRYSNGVLADNVFVPDPDYDSFDVSQQNEQNVRRGTKQKLPDNSRKRDVIGDRLRKTSGSSQISGDSGIDSYPPTFDDYLQALGPGSKSSPHSRQGSRSSGGSGGEPQVNTESVQKSVTFKNSAVVMDSSDADDEEEQLSAFQLKIREKARMMEHKQKQSSVLNDDRENGESNLKVCRHLPFHQIDDNSSNGNDSTTVDAASTSSADFSSPSQLSPSSTSSSDSVHVKSRSVQPFKQRQFTVQDDQSRGSSLLSSQKQKVQGELKNFLGKRLSIDDIGGTGLLKKQSPSSDKLDECGDNSGALDETKVLEHSSEGSSLTISCDDRLNNVISSENQTSVDLPLTRTDTPPNTLDISTDLSSSPAPQTGVAPAPPPPPPLPPPGGIVSSSTSKSSTPSSTAPSTPLSTGPAISLKELQSVSLKKANVAKGNDTGMSQVRNDDLIAELKSTSGITSLKKLRDDMVKRNQDLHHPPQIELDPTDFTPDRFITKVPEETPDGKSIPPWKRQLIAKKEAEKAKKEIEEKLKKDAEEQRLAKIPKWKRDIIEKKEAEARAAREAVEKAIKEREEKERLEKTPKVVAAIPIDVEENKPLAPWIQELRSRKS